MGVSKAYHPSTDMFPRAGMWLVDRDARHTASILLPLAPALQTAPPNFRTILKDQIKKPDYWPVIGSTLFADGDRLWIFGQKGEDGVPTKVVDLEAQTETNYLLPGIPSAIHGGFAYFQSQEDDVLRLERRKIGPAAR